MEEAQLALTDDPTFWWIPSGDQLNGTSESLTPTYSVHMLHRDNPEDWYWHPYVMGRLIRFCNEHGEDADPSGLVRSVQQSFVMDDPGLMVIAFFRDGELIGHILCDRSILYFKPIVTVHQYLLDHGITPEIRRESVDIIRQWAKDTGPDGKREPAEKIQWLVRISQGNRSLVEVYQRMFKAKPDYLLMRLEVENGQ